MKYAGYIRAVFVTCSVMIATVPAVQAAEVERVTGLPNGEIAIQYMSGLEVTAEVFSIGTDEPTLVKQWNDEAVLALQPNGRKIAIIDAFKPNNLRINRTRLADDVRYKTAYLGTAKFGEEKSLVVVAKRGSMVDTIIGIIEDEDVLVTDTARINKKSVAPKRTQLNTSTNRIHLRNKQRSTAKRINVLTSEDPELLVRQSPVSCGERWYESHAHMEDPDALENYVQRLKNNAVGCSLLFVGIEWDYLNTTYAEVRAIIDSNPGRFVPFYNGDPNTLSEISVINLQAILDKDTKNLFRGIGEFAFYQDPLLGTTLTDDPWPEIFAWAADNDLTIMIHLNQDQGTELDTMLTAYPTTRVLLHGSELALAGELADLLAEHDNLFYTLDTANMLNQDLMPIMFPVQGGDEDDVSDTKRANDFIDTYDAAEAEMLANAVATYSDIFTAAPDRVLWGTDVAFAWHMRKAVYRRLHSFSEQFAATLDESVRSNYLNGNAVSLFGEGVTVE